MAQPPPVVGSRRTASCAGPAARSRAEAAIAAVTTEFEELGDAAPGRDGADDGPLSWAGYADSRARATARTGEEESVVHGIASVGGRRCVLVSFEFGFLGGSLGRRTGDRLEAAYDTARTRALPLVSLIATGGSRMQEGMVALTQLQRVARASHSAAQAWSDRFMILPRSLRGSASR
ncbi:carboxyl transferase domain-containing protein [Streptomyces sp. NPDC030920]|uniref:carboxyl transferase domain-containing protein n=1 Tax=Streptomyces sp. NPDC030920 TaxID=3365308 RepID=UPI00384C4A53